MSRDSVENRCTRQPIVCLLVFQDFGSIFSTLLPGTTAKLAPPEGQTELDGLEVKVAFGNVWKESLSELSGGQRFVCNAKDISLICTKRRSALLMREYLSIFSDNLM